MPWLICIFQVWAPSFSSVFFCAALLWAPFAGSTSSLELVQLSWKAWAAFPPKLPRIGLFPSKQAPHFYPRKCSSSYSLDWAAFGISYSLHSRAISVGLEWEPHALHLLERPLSPKRQQEIQSRYQLMQLGQCVQWGWPWLGRRKETWGCDGIWSGCFALQTRPTCCVEIKA